MIADKKAQESRNDLAIMYSICFLLVIITVGTLYEIGVLGDIKDSIGSGTITGAVVVDEESPEEELNTAVNASQNNTLLENG